MLSGCSNSKETLRLCAKQSRGTDDSVETRRYCMRIVFIPTEQTSLPLLQNQFACSQCKNTASQRPTTLHTTSDLFQSRRVEEPGADIRLALTLVLVVR